VGSWTFGGASGTSGWTVFTNCTSCTPGTFTSTTGYAELASHDLPCTGSCSYPGAYAFSPSVAASPGHLTLRFQARAAAAAAAVNVTAFDAGKNALAQTVANVDAGALSTSGATFTLPANTASVVAEVQVTSPNGTLDVASVQLFWQP
jgi:hypothetical protein